MPTTTYTTEEDCWLRASSTLSSADAVAANGSLVIDNNGNTAYVKAGSNYLCARTYYRYDTTALATSVTATSASIHVKMTRARGGTADAGEVHKLFASSDNSSSVSVALYQTITTTGSTTATDVGNSADVFDLVIDGDLLTYLNTQIAAGAKPAFFLRNKGDYDVATEGNASGINTRSFAGGDATFCVLSITYDTAAAVTDNAVFFGSNF